MLAIQGAVIMGTGESEDSTSQNLYIYWADVNQIYVIGRYFNLGILALVGVQAGSLMS